MQPAAVSSARARALLERVLRGGASLAPEYPLVFGKDCAGRLIWNDVDPQMHSACAVLVRDFIAGPHSMRVGLIGCVATDPAHRGQGHATRVLRQAEEQLAREGCTLAMLWADDASFYEARGYQPIGSEVDFVLEATQSASLGSVDGVRAAAADDRAALHRLYSLHRERVDRSCEETLALLAGPNIETLVVQRERDIVAYSCLGRGRDFAHCVHEWAGSAADVLALVREHARRAGARGEDATTYLITPSTAKSLHGRLRARSALEARGILAQAKLLDVHGAAAVLGAQAHTSVDSGDDGAPRIRVHGPLGVATLQARELLDVLMPARGDRRRIEVLERETGLALTELPLPLFAWGLDSI